MRAYWQPIRKATPSLCLPDGTLTLESCYNAQAVQQGVMSGTSLLTERIAPREIITSTNFAIGSAAVPDKIDFDAFPTSLNSVACDRVDAVVAFGIAGRTITTTLDIRMHPDVVEDFGTVKTICWSIVSMIFPIRPFLSSRYHPAQAPRWITILGALMVLAIRPLTGQTDFFREAEPPWETEAAAQVEAPAQPEYTGPAVLSRSNQPIIGQGAASTAVQPYFSFSQIYDTGLTVSSGNTASSAGVLGQEIGFGLRGTHRWKHIAVNIDYEGNWRQYSQFAANNGTNQFLRVAVVTPLRHHLALAVNQTVGTVTQDLGSLLVQPAVLETSSALPINEPFDNRARFLESQATVTYQKSRRLSFTANIDGSLIRLEPYYLVGTDSMSISGDVSYLLSRHATVGLDYDFAHYGYTTFGSADLHTISGDFSWRLRRTVELALQLGMTHGDVLGLVAVPLDPSIAALLGTGTGIRVADQVLSTPAFRFHVAKHWHSAEADLGYQRGISSGNGLILTSKTESIEAGLRYSRSRTWSFSMHGGWTSMQALTGLAATAYTGYLAGVSVNRSIRPSVQMVARFDARPFTYVGPAVPTRNSYRATIGFMFTPRSLLKK